MFDESGPVETGNREDELFMERAQALIDDLKQGRRIDPELRRELLRLLAQQEPLKTAAVQDYERRTITQVWESEPERGTIRFFSEEERLAIDEVALEVMKDLSFISITTKAPRQVEDYANYILFKRDQQLDLSRLAKDSIASVTSDAKSEGGVIFPISTSILEGCEKRTMIILDNPKESDQQIVTYAVASSAHDFNGRSADGGSSLSFSISKENRFFQQLKTGALSPRIFITAILHASMALNDAPKNLLRILSSGSEAVVISDYSDCSTTLYEADAEKGQRKSYQNGREFMRGCSALWEKDHYTRSYKKIPDLDNPDQGYGHQLRDFLEGS